MLIWSLQVHRSSVFADICSGLLWEGVLKLPSGPCIVSPTFLGSLPEDSHSQSSSGQSSVQPCSANSSTHKVRPILQTSEHADEDALDDEAGITVSSSVEVSDNKSGDVSQGLVEEGEGRGPRKEFFALIGAGVTSSGGTLFSSSQARHIWQNML